MSTKLNEKAKSKSQQRLMGTVHGYQTAKEEGKGRKFLDKLDPSFSKTVKDIAEGKKKKTGKGKTKGISFKAAEEFASTKHEGLPKHKKNENVIISFDDFLNENLNEKHMSNIVSIAIDIIDQYELDDIEEVDEEQLKIDIDQMAHIKEDEKDLVIDYIKNNSRIEVI